MKAFHFLKNQRTVAAIVSGVVLFCVLCSTAMPFMALHNTCPNTDHAETTQTVPCSQIQPSVLEKAPWGDLKAAQILLITLVSVSLGFIFHPARWTDRAIFSFSPPQKIFLLYRTLLI